MGGMTAPVVISHLCQPGFCSSITLGFGNHIPQREECKIPGTSLPWSPAPWGWVSLRDTWDCPGATTAVARALPRVATLSLEPSALGYLPKCANPSEIQGWWLVEKDPQELHSQDGSQDPRTPCLSRRQQHWR